jgi:hypothetical protein
MEEIMADMGSNIFTCNDGLLYEGQNLENARLAVPGKSKQPITEMHHDKNGPEINLFLA